MMICGSCGHTETDVKETRSLGSGITRRRSCRLCGARFVTRELPEGSPRLGLVLGLSLDPVPLSRGNVRVTGPGGAVVVRARAAALLQVLSEDWPVVVPYPELRLRVWGRSAAVGQIALTTTAAELNKAMNKIGVAVVALNAVGYALARIKLSRPT